MDEDQAELRLFQEKFLEDGDLHTDYKRTKQFRWAGLDDNIEVRLSSSWLKLKRLQTKHLFNSILLIYLFYKFLMLKLI